MRYEFSDGHVLVDDPGDQGTDNGQYSARFYSISALDSTGHRYLGLANVITCNTCIATFAIEFTFDTTDVHLNIIEQYDGRMYDLETFDFDEATRALSFSYLEETSEPIAPGLLRRRFTGTWQDTGTEFLLTGSCEQTFRVADH